MGDDSAQSDPSDKRSSRDVPPSDKELGRDAATGDAQDKLAPMNSLGEARAAQERTSAKQKEWVGPWLFAVMTAQIIVADLGFFAYACFGVKWVVDPAVMHSWLGATVIQVIAITTIVVRHLYPPRA